MPRNKSEKKHAIGFLDRPLTMGPSATMEGMDAQLAQAKRDTQAMMELLEEAREEANDWRYMWATEITSDHIEVSRLLADHTLPWEEQNEEGE